MSLWQLFYDQFEAHGSLPNRLSVGIGEKIRQAREHIKMSQEELAEAIYRRRASLSDMERGKMYPDIETLIYLSSVLGKPLLYFLPDFAYPHVQSSESLSDAEQALLLQFRRLDEAGQQLAIALLRAQADFRDTSD